MLLLLISINAFFFFPFIPREAGRGDALHQTLSQLTSGTSPAFLLPRLSGQDNAVELSAGWLPSVPPALGPEGEVPSGVCSLCSALPGTRSSCCTTGTSLGSLCLQEASLQLGGAAECLPQPVFFPCFNIFCPSEQFGVCSVELTCR